MLEIRSVCHKKGVSQKRIVLQGKGSGILKRELHKYLKNNRSVVDFKLNIYNDGETIVEIK